MIEAGQTILSQYDSKLTRPVQRRLEALGISLVLNSRLKEWDDNVCMLTLEAPQGPRTLTCNKVLVTAERMPQTDGLGLEELQLCQFVGRSRLTTIARHPCAASMQLVT